MEGWIYQNDLSPRCKKMRFKYLSGEMLIFNFRPYFYDIYIYISQEISVGEELILYLQTCLLI